MWNKLGDRNRSIAGLQRGFCSTWLPTVNWGERNLTSTWFEPTITNIWLNVWSSDYPLVNSHGYHKDKAFVPPGNQTWLWKLPHVWITFLLKSHSDMISLPERRATIIRYLYVQCFSVSYPNANTDCCDYSHHSLNSWFMLVGYLKLYHSTWGFPT